MEELQHQIEEKDEKILQLRNDITVKQQKHTEEITKLKSSQELKNEEFTAKLTAEVCLCSWDLIL